MSAIRDCGKNNAFADFVKARIYRVNPTVSGREFLREICAADVLVGTFDNEEGKRTYLGKTGRFQGQTAEARSSCLCERTCGMLTKVNRCREIIKTKSGFFQSVISGAE
ncbi:hypothetical protein U14_03720 [Candidatus Moduliflexus flocculans]|uniref:Uncharacterized protein n=1 Tax=Candidatus Moduliflexus flocculans TaxID=1499966 RepID=A0A081BQ03_9BACT|nr:hypothetical protein U14_03720 [Candidatus Moduliflexus flocculans]